MSTNFEFNGAKFEYSGKAHFDCPSHLKVHKFFMDHAHDVSHWNISNFLQSNPSQADEFIAGLETIINTKSVAGPIRAFCTNQRRHFKTPAGDLELVYEISKALTDRGNKVIKEQAYVAFQRFVISQQQQGATSFDSYSGVKLEQPATPPQLEEGLDQGRMDEIGQALESGHVSEKHFQDLNLRTKWKHLDIDVLAIFKEYAEARSSDTYELAADEIADLTLHGSWTRSLSDDAYHAALFGTLELESDTAVEKLVDKVFAEGAHFSAALTDLRAMDHQKQDVQYISEVFTGLQHFIRTQTLQGSPNERQLFADLILPGFVGAMEQEGLPVRTFEVIVRGSTKRQNNGKNALIDRKLPGHQADAIVEVPEGYQLVIMESARLFSATDEKVVRDHFKLARDMKDTYIDTIKLLISNNRQPPPDLTVFGIQVCGAEATFLAMDYLGAFRLYDLGHARIPNTLPGFRNQMAHLLGMFKAFARLVATQYRSYSRLSQLSIVQRRAYDRAVNRIKVTSTTPTKTPKTPRKDKKRKTECDDDEDDE
ncbi:hypothetical protein BGX29_006498 [Mortierella sp. GBA35]|nr:hypothetical protein BGX29_006498 [Mortierella sp. GBA35]